MGGVLNRCYVIESNKSYRRSTYPRWCSKRDHWQGVELCLDSHPPIKSYRTTPTHLIYRYVQLVQGLNDYPVYIHSVNATQNKARSDTKGISHSRKCKSRPELHSPVSHPPFFPSFTASVTVLSSPCPLYASIMSMKCASEI